MLIVVLLPVISMTDDLRTISAAEVEHIARRVDLLPDTVQPADIVPALDSEYILGIRVFAPTLFARVEADGVGLRPQPEYVRVYFNKPPPASI